MASFQKWYFKLKWYWKACLVLLLSSALSIVFLPGTPYGKYEIFKSSSDQSIVTESMLNKMNVYFEFYKEGKCHYHTDESSLGNEINRYGKFRPQKRNPFWFTCNWNDGLGPYFIHIDNNNQFEIGSANYKRVSIEGYDERHSNLSAIFIFASFSILFLLSKFLEKRFNKNAPILHENLISDPKQEPTLQSETSLVLTEPTNLIDEAKGLEEALNNSKSQKNEVIQANLNQDVNLPTTENLYNAEYDKLFNSNKKNSWVKPISIIALIVIIIGITIFLNTRSSNSENIDDLSTGNNDKPAESTESPNIYQDNPVISNQNELSQNGTATNDETTNTETNNIETNKTESNERISSKPLDLGVVLPPINSDKKNDIPQTENQAIIKKDVIELPASEKTELSKSNGDNDIVQNPPTMEIKNKKASFPGGESSMRQFLKNNIIFPSNFIQDNSSRSYLLKIKKDGKISSAKYLQWDSVDPLNLEGLRVISKMPKWTPELSDGKPVEAEAEITIYFYPKR